MQHNIYDPEYGKQILSRFSTDIIVYDYTIRPKEQNPLGHIGISLIIWDGKYNCVINYQPDRVLFKIEDSSNIYINNNIFHDSLTKAHYEYYSEYISYIKSHEKIIKELSNGFRQILPIDYVRNEKIKEII